MKQIKTLIYKIKLLFRYIQTQQYFLAEELLAKKEFQEPNCLLPYGFKVYSQNDEDAKTKSEFYRRFFAA